MKKTKLLLAAAALMLGGSMWAQTDVTNTYLTNADFEGEYTSYSQPKSDRNIYQPNGWTISYTNGEGNDMTSLNSSCTQWSNFSSKPQPANGGSNTYWMRFRWGSSENITLSQETSANLPAGTYAVTVDAYSDDNTGTATISAAEVSQTVRSNGAWANYAVVFTLASAQKVTISLSYTNTAADDLVAAFDNVKILDLNSEPTGIALRNVLGGIAASLSDFNVWYDDYTLEVEGTADTEITVAADNISYTPEADGTVRFVKKDGIVYVFEGATYKTAVHSSKAAYVYSTSLSSSDSETGNILENGSFETVGDVLTANKAWKLGSPWTVDNFSWGGDGSGIRVQLNGSTKRLVWRGSGNNAYFSQPVDLVPYKGYKTFLQQVGGGNATAQFNVGLGNAAGDYSYMSTQFTLGNGKNGTYNAELGINGNVGSGYFSFRNTSNNTASSGSDPVTQIDWIGLVGSDDFPISGVSSASYVYGTAYAPATSKASYLAAKAEAEATIADATYDNVTGEERNNLQDAIDAVVADNDAAYDTATGEIQDAISTFTDALSHYQALIDAQDAVPDLAYASTSASAFKTAVATSASDADAKLTAITPAVIRAYYESHALAEGVSCPINKTSLIVNPVNPTNTSGWTVTNTTGDCKMRTMSNEPYTNSDETTATGYFDTNSWGAAFTSTFTQSVNLPAGDYMLTVKARGNGTTTYQLTAGGESTDITTSGGSGGVFGRGWNDFSVEFTVASAGDVTIGINMVTGASANWLSFGDFRLVRIDATAAGSSEYTALNSAITTANGHTLGFEDGEYAPYSNVDALTLLAEAKAVNQSANNAKDEIEALTTALSEATWTANDGAADIIYNGLFATVAEGQNYPKGWTRTNGWGQMQSGLSGDHATAYYNQPGSLQYGNQGVYTMPLAENTTYKLTFSYRSHETNSNNGVTASVLNGENGLTATSFPANHSTSDWKTVSAYFTTGAAAGNYVLTLANDGNTWMTNVSLVKTDALEFADNAEMPAYTPGTYPTVKITRTLTAGRWATAVYPFAVSKSADLKIATLNSYDASTGTLDFAAPDASTANVPFLMRSTAGVTEITLTDVEVAAADATDATADEASLKGVYIATDIDDTDKNYVLSANKIYSVGTDGATINPYRAYIQIEQASDVKALNFFIDGDEATGIEDLNVNDNLNEGAIYNLAGQRISKMQKGINIVNGKKVLF